MKIFMQCMVWFPGKPAAYDWERRSINMGCCAVYCSGLLFRAAWLSRRFAPSYQGAPKPTPNIKHVL